MIAHKIDLFLDHEATTATIEPRPIPPSIALLESPSFSDLANKSVENVAHQAEMDFAENVVRSNRGGVPIS